MAGMYRPGDKVNQDQLAEEFGISRLPVREALIVLEAEGLIENIARRGAFVAQLSRDDIFDRYAVYGVVAGLAAARAAADATPDDFTALTSLIIEMKQAGDDPRLDGLCFDFHRRINIAGSTRHLRSELRRLSEGIPPRLFNYSSEWRAQAQQDHREILDALEAGNAKMAFDATSEHMNRSGKFAVSVLEHSGFWVPNDQGGSLRRTERSSKAGTLDSAT
jgi:DNA-binding GntR family transcriptional regulator